ncbi:MAG: thioredoxin family protein [Chlamydiales bacterium]
MSVFRKLKVNFLAILVMVASPIFGWTTQYQEALEQGSRENKPLLLYFTGSDWSGWGMKMKNEILDSKAFKEKTASSFICVEIDFPQHKSLSAEEASQNTLLKERFRVKEYPALILIDPEEREIVRLGYLPESGEQLANDLLRIVKQDGRLCQGLTKLDALSDSELFEIYYLAQELGRTDAIDTILEAGLKLNDTFFQLEKYRLLVETGKMDSAEGRSLKEQLLANEAASIHFRVATIEFQELAKKPAENRQKAIQPLEDYLARFKDKDPENVWRIEMMIAQFYLESDEWRTALKHAEIAHQTAPPTMRPTIEHSLNYIRDQVGQIAQK